MKRTGTRRLSIKRETLRRLIANDLAQVAGGRGTCCTYALSGCAGVPSGVCLTVACQSVDCGPGTGYEDI